MSRSVDFSEPRPFQQQHASCTLASRITIGIASTSGPEGAAA